MRTRAGPLNRWLDALKAAGAGMIFREKVSGERADRPQLTKLMAGLKTAREMGFEGSVCAAAILSH